MNRGGRAPARGAGRVQRGRTAVAGATADAKTANAPPGPQHPAARRGQPRIATRPAGADDIAFILGLAPRFVGFALPRGRRKRDTLHAIRDELERTLRGAPPADHFAIAEAAGHPAGFVHLQTQRDFFSGQRTCHVSDLAVAAGYEGRGIGRTLLAYAEAWARRHRCALLTLTVFPGNTRARALYARAGFIPELLRLRKPLRQQRAPRA